MEEKEKLAQNDAKLVDKEVVLSKSKTIKAKKGENLNQKKVNKSENRKEESKTSSPKVSKADREEKNRLKLEGLRTNLAVRQTFMSCERSLLSYIRTACVFVSLAFTYLKIASYDQFDAFVIVMFLIGFSFLVYGVIEFILRRSVTKKLSRHVKEEFLSVGDNIGDEEDL